MQINFREVSMNYLIENVHGICKNARKGNHRTQGDVAKDTGFTQSFVSQFEKGTRRSEELLIYYIVTYGIEMMDYYLQIRKGIENGH